MLRVGRSIAFQTWLPVWVLCVTQIVSWGTLYYAFAAILAPITAERGWRQSTTVGAFSLSLLFTGAAAYPAGRLIQRFNGRIVMTAGSLLAAAALAVVAGSQTLVAFYIGWALAGIASAATLYEPAFAVLANVYGTQFRRALTMVVIVGEFASSVFWPLTERLTVWFGWRNTIALYAVLHLVLCSSLHWFGLRRAGQASPGNISRASLRILDLVRRGSFLRLAGSFMLSSAVFTVISIHLIPILQSSGMSSWQSVSIAALAGPMQVTGRVVDFLLGGSRGAQRSGIGALALLILSLAVLSLLPWPVIAVCMYGAANGVMTVVRGLSIAESFGREHYAHVASVMSVSSTLARSVAPPLASFAVEYFGGYEYLLAGLASLSILSLLCFWREMKNTHAVARVGVPREFEQLQLSREIT